MESRGRPQQSALAALVARRFYIDGLNKSEIAAELPDVSRFQVARLLALALRDGIVKVEITAPNDLDVELGAAVERRYGLPHALVLAQASDAASEDYHRLGQLAAAHLREIISPGQILGVAWGRTMEAMVSGLSDLPELTAVQLVGGVTTADGARSSSDVVQRLGNLEQVSCYPLHAPLLVQDPHVAASVRATAPVSDTLAWFDRLDVAVVGVGSWDPPSSSLFGAMPSSIREELRSLGAVSDICACVLDSAGREVDSSLAGRVIAIGAAQLQSVPLVIAVAAGTEKVTALRSALASGMIHTLVTDYATASRLVEDASASS